MVLPVVNGLPAGSEGEKGEGGGRRGRRKVSSLEQNRSEGFRPNVSRRRSSSLPEAYALVRLQARTGRKKRGGEGRGARDVTAWQERPYLTPRSRLPLHRPERRRRGGKKENRGGALQFRDTFIWRYFSHTRRWFDQI